MTLVAEGTKLPTIVKTFTFEDMVLFSTHESAVPRGDESIHTSREAAARRTGYDRTVAQALMSYGLMFRALIAQFGPAWFEGGAFKAAFMKSVLEGDEISARGEVTWVLPGPDGAETVFVSLWCTNQNQQQTAAGHARLVLGGKPETGRKAGS